MPPGRLNPARAVPPADPLEHLADRLLAVELPDLAPARRAETVAFVGRRVAGLPTPLRAGVAVLTLGVGVAIRVAGIDRTTAFLRDTRLPFVGELARLVRSLGFTFVWERWPDTGPTGSGAAA